MKYLNWLLIGLVVLCLSTVPLAGCVLEPGVPESEYEALEAELADARVELSDTMEELEKIRSSLAQLKATKEITFGNGLRVFDLDKRYYEVGGKIQNVSSAPMGKVVIVVAFYDADGQLDEDWGSVATDIVRDLFPGEVGEWEVSFGNWTDQDVGLFDVYAIGSKR